MHVQEENWLIARRFWYSVTFPFRWSAVILTMRGIIVCFFNVITVVHTSRWCCTAIMTLTVCQVTFFHGQINEFPDREFPRLLLYSFKLSKAIEHKSDWNSMTNWGIPDISLKLSGTFSIPPFFAFSSAKTRHHPAESHAKKGFAIVVQKLCCEWLNLFSTQFHMNALFFADVLHFRILQSII